ncbi:helix-turn-helix domain-containing protein [Shewanella sp. YLB-07]|uniref:helix-turn-helix domain-containing protein n=1 Tax=Shewanella sp. YLB-07 TaxID=2601268 RepID=UPI00128C7557|nr:helix-turn-helix domain-containing protein [Shewanella sp. YLB-07]MPY24553.1 helix-turn-helix domain-containing protein [Shewanella sp. YLB-07]
MHKAGVIFLTSLGELVRAHRADSMDQTELGLRVGLSRSTISAIEKGVGVNSASLVKVLDHLGLLDPLQQAADERLYRLKKTKSRKSRTVKQALPNDF